MLMLGNLKTAFQHLESKMDMMLLQASKTLPEDFPELPITTIDQVLSFRGYLGNENNFSVLAPSNSVINSLFKDDEPEGFVFSKYEEKRKQLAEQRRAEYNAYLEKREAERLSKQRISQEKKNVSPKSILDAVDYKRIVAKRKEEEARFRNTHIDDILHHSQPILNEENKKPVSSTPSSSYASPRFRNNDMPVPAVNISKTSSISEDVNTEYPELKEKRSVETLDNENFKLLEERIDKQLEEQRRQMLLEFENEIRKNNIIKQEIQSLKSSSSVRSSPIDSPQKRNLKTEDVLHFKRTGGGGDPVRDSYGNLLTMRGQRRKSSAELGNMMSFPSMHQQPLKDRMTLYREELQKQIEEKRRLEALEREKAREQEEKIAQRIEEQRLKMLQEYENELKKNNKIKEEFQRQQERIKKLEEFQKKDAEARRKKLPEVRARSPAPEKPVVPERSNSPPIPAVRTKVLLEKAVEAVPEVVKPESTFSSLAEIRRKIMEEQQKPKNYLKKSYEVMNRRTVQEISDEEDDDILKTSTNSYQYSA